MFSKLPGEHENSQLRRVSVEEKESVCVFCRRSEVDEINLGPLYKNDVLVTHYFCMMFSAGLSQQGSDVEGILGFLTDDIHSEVRRASRLKCIYCHVSGAAIGCCDRRCKATYHFPCGLRNGANFQFHGNFESFCIAHSKRRVLTEIPEDLKCSICLMPHETTQEMIVGGCCKGAVFHRECVQQYAYSAGYFFKCAHCANNQPSFLQDMKSQGVFVPDQDAAWETEPNAYQELLEQYSHCDAKECNCPKGRKYGAAKGQWLLARCRLCGAAGSHRQCGKMTTIANWACSSCLEVETRTNLNKPKKPVSTKRSAEKFTTTGSKSSTTLGTNNVTEKSSDRKPVLSVTSKQNRKVKRTGTKMLPGDLEKIGLRSIIIAATCRDFFPHDKATIVNFAERKSMNLPDWRMLKLRIPLVDVLHGHGGDSSAEANAERSQEVPTDNSIKKRKRSTDGTLGPKKQRKKNPTGEKRKKNTKTSNWQKGVLKKSKAKKRGSTPVSLSIQSEDHNIPINGMEVGSQNGLESGSTEPPTSKSPTAVLEGIRRSHSSLINWLSGTSSIQSSTTTSNTNGNNSNGIQNGSTTADVKTQNGIKQEVQNHLQNGHQHSPKNMPSDSDGVSNFQVI